MSVEVKIPKKLIEVALPLDAINVAAAREKSIRHGHPSTLHMWWARRPLAAARAVLFAQLVNDPGYERSLGRGVNKELAQKERERLFAIIEQLIQWNNTNNNSILQEANEEIFKSWAETCALNKDHPNAKELFNPAHPPDIYDPFAGGGAIPSEAQRLGLNSYASDLNQVAVLINKATIEIPPKFSGRPPISLIEKKQNSFSQTWPRATGLAEDVRFYGALLGEQVFKKIGHHYPTMKITSELVKNHPELKNLVGEEVTIQAWLWTRTVFSPNPAFSHVQVPIASSFVLSDKENREAYVLPIIKGDSYSFQVKQGSVPQKYTNGTKMARGANFRCLLSDVPIDSDYIKSQGVNGRLGVKLMAIVADSSAGRVFISPCDAQESVALKALPPWKPDLVLPNDPRNFWTVSYGLKTFGDLFTNRQLLALSTFAETIDDLAIKIHKDAKDAGMKDDNISLGDGGIGATAYSQAICTYLSFAISKCADYWSSIATWMPRGTVGHTFSKQAIPMTWDFPEANPFGNFHCAWTESFDWVAGAIDNLPARGVGIATQADARQQNFSSQKVISTDPPYYDNIAYSDLSDYFLVWLNHSLRNIYPSLLSKKESPKDAELVATPYRHGGKKNAENYFLDGMKIALSKLGSTAHPAFPITIYYAFKASETNKSGETSSTGWETFLEALIQSGFSLSGTWPMRTERANRSIGIGTNALASSIVLVCRRRQKDAPVVSRREFIRELNIVLPDALSEMTTGHVHSPVAPVDLSQAIIGPGMAVFSKYSAVLEADGSSMNVKTALQLINRFLTQDDFDHDTQFCLSWLETNGWTKGKFGEADVLARAKGTSVDGLRNSGVIESLAGSLRILRFNEYEPDWSPEFDSRLSIWELLHQLLLKLDKNGENGAGEILSRCNHLSEQIRTLAYRLYTLCERKGWAKEAGQYNALIVAWDAIEAAARSVGYSGTQISLFGENEPTENQTTTKKKSTRKSK